jgi:hypothetical protein
MNLGICIVEFNQLYEKNILVLNNKLIDFINKDNSRDEFIKGTMEILKEIDTLVTNILKIKWLNTVNLIPNLSVADVPVVERINRLKTLLSQLDTIAKPDLILIEYQMGPNDDMRTISSCIAYHYASSNSEIEYKVPTYKINNILQNTHCITPTIKLVSPGLKNTYSLAPNGAYSNFIVKYSNYVANKKHTTHNFMYFIKHFIHDSEKILSSTKGKLNDIADSFLMIYSYLKKNKMLR